MIFPSTGRSIAAPMISLAVLLVLPAQGLAQEQDEADAPSRTRVMIGAQLVPSYPGADDVSVSPLIGVARARGDEQFAFRAPDQSFGFPVFQKGGFSLGPSLGIEGKRPQGDASSPLPAVGTTVEIGIYTQYQATEHFRLHAELRRGFGGHKGFISVLGADYVMRDGDQQLLSVGPRVTVTNGSYQDAYFSVPPEDAVEFGLEPYELRGGIQSVGATAGYLRQFSPRWGMYGYVKYDQLVGDLAGSPVVEQFGSRHQYSGGVALTYTFGKGVNAR